jgi:hypothetical protein
MRIVPLALSCLACASFVPPAAAEPAPGAWCPG